MSWKRHCKNALFALALTSLIAPQAEAIEIFTGANAATHINDDLFTQVRGGRGGGGGGGGMRHHGGGGMHRGGGIWWDAQAGRRIWRRAQAGRSIWRQRQSQHQQERQS